MLPFLLAAQLILVPGSRLWIEGDSNLHAWSCEAKTIDAQLEVDPAAPQIARGLAVHVPVADIDCGNGGMNSRLRDALKTPSIDFKLVSAERVPGDGIQLVARGRLTIAGQTHEAVIPVEGTQDPDGSIHATGSLPMKMSDFGVEAPSMLFLKTADQITVKFDIRATQPAAAHAAL